MSMYNATVPQLTKMLGNLDRWLDKAAAHASEHGYDVEVLLNSRLYPDQFHFIRQVQAACDTAKFAVARLSETAAPSHPDTETTIEELKARIAATSAFVQSISAEAMAGSGDRTIPLPFAKGMAAHGAEYLNSFVLPNLYFHLATAYGILRHNGVPLGKVDFIGSIDLFPLE